MLFVFVALKGRGRGLTIELEPENQGTVLLLIYKGLFVKMCLITTKHQGYIQA